MDKTRRGLSFIFPCPADSSTHLLPGQTAGAVRRGQAAGVGRAIEKQEAGGAQVPHIHPGRSRHATQDMTTAQS